MFAEISRRLWVFVVVSTPLGALAQAAGTPGGLEKPKAVLTTLQTVLLGLSGILVSASLIGCGIAMAFYRKKWEDLQAPVLGGVVIGAASGIGSWLVS